MEESEAFSHFQILLCQQWIQSQHNTLHITFHHMILTQTHAQIHTQTHAQIPTQTHAQIQEIHHLMPFRLARRELLSTLLLV